MISHALIHYLIPGSFRPPHRGHYEMIRHYLNLAYVNNGYVTVFISNPSGKNIRTTAKGIVIPPEYVKEKLEKVFKNHDNISFVISEKSPVTDCYEYGSKITNGTVILCCSNKGNDIERFDSIKSYYSKKFPNINVSVEPFEIKTNISSSLIRLRL